MDQPSKNIAADERDTEPIVTDDLFVTHEPPRSFPEFTQKIFVGPEGVRWIWRLLVYFAIREFIYLLLGSTLTYADQAGIFYLWVNLMAEAILLLAAVVPAFILAPLEDRKFGEYGLPLRKPLGKW